MVMVIVMMIVVSCKQAGVIEHIEQLIHVC